MHCEPHFKGCLCENLGKTPLAHFVPSTCIESTTSPKEIVILDIAFFKGLYFKEFGIFDTACHRKPLNTYMYLPWRSSHPLAHKKGFITGELKRYVIRESSKKTSWNYGRNYEISSTTSYEPKDTLQSFYPNVNRLSRTLHDLTYSLPNPKKKILPVVLKLLYSPCIKKL